jgi:methyl-accepting chemotaxis protein
LVLSAVVVAVLVSASFIVTTNTHKSIGDLVFADNAQIATARSGELGQLIEKLHWQLRALSLSDQLVSADRKKVPVFIKSLLVTTSDEAIDHFFAWPNGDMITSSGTQANIADRDYFDAIMNGGSSFTIGRPVLSKTLGVPIVVFAQAVNGRDGSLLGIVAFQVKLSTLSAISSGIKIGRTGYGWIVDQTGIVIAHKDSKAVMTLNIIAADQKGYKGMDAFGKEVLGADSGRGAWVKPDGTPYTAFFAKVPYSPGWKLGLSLPTAEIYETSDVLDAILVAIFVAGMVLFVIVVFLLSRSIVAPIKLAASSFRELAKGEANLTRSIGLGRRQDEIGDLVSDFNIFLAKLREIVVDIKGAQSGLSDIGERLSTSVEGTEGAITRMTSDIETIRDRGLHQAASVEESSSTVSQIAHNISSLDNLIADQASGITEASAAIEEMVGNIGSVTSSVSKMASEFSTLAKASESGKATLSKAAERITQIAEQSRSLLETNEIIASIASSTNLLAMNAAIEAAHAGEAGKGFSVVADEIRRLSETATEQSRTIGEELGLILKSIGDIVELSKESGEAFSIVAGKIDATDSLVKEVDQAMSEQGEGSKQILEALREMNDITSQVKTGSSEMSAGNQALLEEMARLRDTAFDIKERVEAMTKSAGDIGANVRTVSDMAQSTRGTIGTLETAVGRFTV